MIRELVDYTYSHGLVTRSGYAPKAVKWAVDITNSGQYLGITVLGDPTLRGNAGVTFPVAPHLEQSELVAGGQTRCHFLIETAAVVAQWLDDSGRDAAKNAAKHQFFVGMLAQAKVGVPDLDAWERCLSDPATLERIRADLKSQRAKATDRVTVRCDGRFLVESNEWHGWWESFRSQIRPAGANLTSGQCLVTGEFGTIAPTHPKITGLASVGGSSMGSVLVSFDKDAFASYGLQQGANAPMLESVAGAYKSALNDLIGKGLKLAGMRVVYWYKEPVPQENDPLAFLGTPPSEGQERQALSEAERTLKAFNAKPEETLGIAAPSGNRYYLMLLSAAQARVMVRAWYEGAYEELKNNVIQWFSDLGLVRLDGGPPKRTPFYSLLRQLAVEERELPPSQVRNLWEAAVMNRAIPLAVAQAALQRIRHDIVRASLPTEGAVALLKIFLVRKKGLVKHEMDSALNPDRPEAAYQLGRLLAVFGNLQSAENLSARGGLSSRFYTAASVAPVMVFARLFGLSEHYLTRLSSDALRQWYRNQITEIMNRMTNIPRTLTFEQQALFALGYYHQIAHFRSSRSDGKETK